MSVKRLNKFLNYDDIDVKNVSSSPSGMLSKLLNMNTKYRHREDTYLF